MVATLGCSAAPQQPRLIDQSVSGLPRLAGDGDRAYVADASGLVELDPTGASQVVARPPIRWCATDAKARVVWFISGLGLAAFDLDDRRLYPLILDGLLGISIIVDHGEGEVLAPAVADYPVAIRIAVRDAPAIRVEEGCADPNVFDCYDDQGVARPDLVELRERAAKLRLADIEYVASLAARAGTGSIWRRGPQPDVPGSEHAIECGWASGASR